MNIFGFIHLHSQFSYDGKVGLGTIKEIFLAKGAKFLAVTEHTKDLTRDAAAHFIAETHRLTDESFLIIPGFEITYKNAHILAVGVKEFVEENNPYEALQMYKEQGALIILAHPHRNKFSLDKEVVSLLHGIEVWNLQYDGSHAPRTKSLSYYQTLKKQNPHLVPIASLDFHCHSHQFGPALYLDVSNFLTIQILDKIKNGDFVFGRKQVRLPVNFSLSCFTRWRYSIISFGSICVVSLSKYGSRLLSRLNMKPPLVLKKLLRKII